MKDCAAQLQLLPQHIGVGQRAVVRQRHQTLDVVDGDGLRVLTGIDAGGPIADVADCDVALAQGVEHIPGKHIVDQARVLMAL